MIAIRFHGRGGQGVKTASRILGTAAFLEGHQAQDSPIYGAERRGAPVWAFTRISKEPIRERGLITHPDLVVIADASLVDDPVARVTDGLDERTAVFVNSPLTAEQVLAQVPLTPGSRDDLGYDRHGVAGVRKRGSDQCAARRGRGATRRTSSGVDSRGDRPGVGRSRA